MLIVLQLLAMTLAFGQAGKPPASTDKSGTTPAKIMSAVAQTREDSRHPSRFAYQRLYCTPDGNSHWENLSVELRKSYVAVVPPGNFSLP